MTADTYPQNPVLIVDDEQVILKSYKLALKSVGINHLMLMNDSRKVMETLSQKEVDCILLDVNLPYINGYDLLKQIVVEHPGIPVIMITGNQEVELAVRCMKKNAFDYMVKPVEKARLVSGVKRALEIRRLERENRHLKDQFSDISIQCTKAFEPVITQNPAMLTLFKYVESVAQSPHPILITGDTGTGKELMAHAVHTASRKKGPFISINVAGIDDNAFSDTLFGHEKGAFTGADHRRSGLIEKAAAGTLFLDEIGDLKNESQVKLLRLLQEHEYFPLGSDIPKIMNARVVVATNMDLKKRQEQNRFRKDLYYRLSSHQVHLPPLKDRIDDLAILVDLFLEDAAKECQKPKPAYPRELITLLSNYDFPGNIRELKGMIDNAVSVHQNKILSLDLFEKMIGLKNKSNPTTNVQNELTHNDMFNTLSSLPTLADAQIILMKEALRRTDNNKSMAAKILGISRQKMIRHLKSEKE